MARLFNETPYAVEVVPLIDRDGRTVGVVVAKGTYQIEPSGELRLAPEQVPVQLADEYLGDPARSDLRVPTDLVDFKPAAEVIVVGPSEPLDRSFVYGRKIAVEVGPVAFAGTMVRRWEFGPVRRDQKPRKSFAGTYDQDWADNRMPLVPKDFDPRYHLAAPARQINAGFFTGDERLRLSGLHAEGQPVDTRLPGRVVVVGGNVLYRYYSTPAVLDTVILWAERPLVTLVWRLAIPTRKNMRRSATSTYTRSASRRRGNCLVPRENGVRDYRCGHAVSGRRRGQSVSPFRPLRHQPPGRSALSGPCPRMGRGRPRPPGSPFCPGAATRLPRRHRRQTGLAAGVRHSRPRRPGSHGFFPRGAEPFRPGYRFPGAEFDPRPWLAGLGVSASTPCETVPAGSSSAQAALVKAEQLLGTGQVRACVIGAVDTLLQIQVIRWLENYSRLKCSYVNDGLMPGEASCFLVLERETSAQGRGAVILARVLSSVTEVEAANILSDLPNTARGLTTAVRAALRDAETAARNLGAVWCDLNGESYRAREWAFTEIRNGLQTHTELIHPADCHGDLGTVNAANLLGLAALAQATGWAGGKPLLVFTASEGGLRAATVIGPPPGQPPLVQMTRELPRVVSAREEVSRLGPDEPDFLEAENPPRVYFDWQLRQEHLDTLAALHYQRKAILRNPALPWPRLREPEQRILNHLDAAVAGGAESIWAVASGLLDGEEGKAFAGALLLGVLPTPANLARMDAALKPKPPVLAGIEAGLRHAPVSKPLLLHLETWLDHDEPAVQALAVSVLSYRRELEARRIVPFIKSTDPRLRLAGIRAARRHRHPGAAPALEALRTTDDPVVLREALLALLCLGHRNVPAQCRNLIAAAPPAAQVPWLLALAGQGNDLAVLLRANNALADPMTLAALGILGNVGAVRYLLQALEASDDKVKVAAAEALELMTASGQRERAVLVEKTELLPGEFIEERREVERVATAADAWRDWWAQHGRKLDPVRRWRRGQPFDYGVVLAELKAPATRFHDRQRAYWELLIQSGQSFPFEPDWFVPRQQQALAEWDSWWDTAKPR